MSGSRWEEPDAVFRIEIVANERADAVNLLREVARLVREGREVSGREVQYCVGAYRVVVSCSFCEDGTDPDEPADRGCVCRHDPRGVP